MQTANLFVMIILSGISGVKPVAVQGFLTIDECKQAIPSVVMERGLLDEGTKISCVPSSSIKKDIIKINPRRLRFSSVDIGWDF